MRYTNEVKERCAEIMKDLYEKGLSYRTFIMNLDDDIRNKFMKYYIPLTINDEQKKKMEAVQKKIRILGVVEGWCPDCQINLPVLEKLISTNNNIELRLVLRDAVKDELKDYEVDGKVKVPTFIFMDEDFSIISAFIEKPKPVKEADINTVEGSKIAMLYKAGRLAQETAEEFANCLSH